MDMMSEYTVLSSGSNASMAMIIEDGTAVLRWVYYTACDGSAPSVTVPIKIAAILAPYRRM